MTSRAGCLGAITSQKSILLVEPWFEGSHRAWAEGYQAHSRHQVALITLPGRFWRWRLRGAAVTLAEQVSEFCRLHGPPDILLVSSMVDLAELVGLARASLSDSLVVSYLHENQVAYPHTEANDVDAAYRSWASMVAADMILVNSRYHLEVLRDGLLRLLADAPDHSHLNQLDEVMARATVMPVGVDLSDIAEVSRAPGVPVVLWNHRWDEDKNPDVFVRGLEQIASEGIEFGVVLAGHDAWDREGRRREAERRLGSRVVASGFATRDVYLEHLHGADVVVSVADHEFFGVAVVEAMASGCVPVLPQSLSYPELVPPRFHEAALYTPGTFRSALAQVLSSYPNAKDSVVGLAEAMRRYDWSTVAPSMDETLASAFERGDR